MGPWQRVFSADDLAMLEHSCWNRGDQRDPGDAGAAVQLSPFAGEHPRITAAALRGHRTPAWTGLRSEVDRMGKAVPDAARHARRRCDGGDPGSDRRDG